MSLEGIITLEGPIGSNSGQFQLPAEFDQGIFAANWVLAGPAVVQAQQNQPILGTRKAAVGWSVWKYPKGHKDAGRTAKVTLSKGEYILMFRKRSIQNNVNAIYGNVSKQHLIREQRGETIAGQPIKDPGVLNDARIARNYGVRDFGDDYEMNVPLNPEPSAAQVESAPEVVAET